MKNKSIKAAKNQGHEDCEDCRREKAENQALIGIYEKLQKIDEKTKTMKKSVDFHRTESLSTKNRFHDFKNRLQSMPKKSKVSIELQHLGCQIARQMVEENKKGAIVKENQRLQWAITQMHKPKLNKKVMVNRENKSFSGFEIQTTEPLINRQTKLSRYSEKRVEQNPITEEDERTENQTKTTDFFSTKGYASYFSKSSQKKEKIDNLSLWLYESKKNSDLEQELYLTAAEKTLSFLGKNKKRNTVLPVLASKK